MGRQLLRPDYCIHRDGKRGCRCRAGANHSLALKNDGIVVAGGDNSYGQSNVPSGLMNAAIAAGGSHSLACRHDGTVVGWGGIYFGQATVPAGLTNVVDIAAGGNHSWALRSDGTVVAWGYNGSGQTTVPAGLGTVSAVAAGYSHSLALKSNGRSWLGGILIRANQCAAGLEQCGSNQGGLLTLLRVLILNALQRWEFAPAVGEGAIERYPELGDLYLATATAKRRFKNIEAAKAILLAGEPLLKEQAILHFNLACYECQLGNFEAAKERLTIAVSIDEAFKAMALEDRDLEPLWGSLSSEWP
jgi:hypothetical protein